MGYNQYDSIGIRLLQCLAQILVLKTQFGSFQEILLSGKPIKLPRQYNRILYFTLSKASKWSFTITQEWTKYESAQNIDPYYNPLEALVYGDIKYFEKKYH